MRLQTMRLDNMNLQNGRAQGWPVRETGTRLSVLDSCGSSTISKETTTKKIEMTAPVTTYVTPGAGPSCESTITVSFFVPPEQQADPPKPSENNICIEERAQTTVYVRSFGGFTNAAKNQEQLLQLSESLKRDGKLFDENVYYTAGYDSPFKLFNRHNEVWLIAQN